MLQSFHQMQNIHIYSEMSKKQPTFFFANFFQIEQFKPKHVYMEQRKGNVIRNQDFYWTSWQIVLPSRSLNAFIQPVGVSE